MSYKIPFYIVTNMSKNLQVSVLASVFYCPFYLVNLPKLYLKTEQYNDK